MPLSDDTDCRCKHCGALLAKRDGAAIAIRRGDMQTTITGGDFTVAVICYRCRSLNVVTARRPEPRPPTKPASAAA